MQKQLPGLENIEDYHDFRQRLEFANVNTKVLRLEAFYKSAFPNVVSVLKVTNIEEQRQGIDTIAILASDKRVCFDEKIRSKDWGDILLEEYSVWKGYPRLSGREFGIHEAVPPELERFLKLGWISAEKKTDYITYVIKPSRKVYFLPFLLLQRAWRIKHGEWLTEYGRRPARNKTYWTTNVPIPTDVLFDSLYATATW